MHEPAKPMILVVDDTEVNIDLMVETLGEDYDVSVALDGEAALESVDEDPPDLILLDIMMPGMDGYEVCERLKAVEETRDIPVIFVTAKTEVEDEVKGFKLGAVDYITKPISPPRVLERVQTHLKLREASRRLEAQNARLVEAARLREDVDLIMRHDLKGPLSSIIGIPATLKEKGNFDREQEASLEVIEASGYRLLNMVNLSLDLMKMERGEYPFHPAPVDMIDLLGRIGNETKTLADTKQIAIRLLVSGIPADERSSFYMMGEELLCYSMFSNLIKNALEASPEGAAVTIRMDRESSGVVRIHNPGAVPKEIREHFFDKYVTSGKSSGTGLGTYSARLIAETQGGQIALSTSESDGTTISVLLPAAETPMPDKDLDPDVQDRAENREKGMHLPELDVLLVDDDPFNIQVLQKFIADPRLKTESAENGKIAFEKIQSVAYDIVFMDMEMPVLNGVEAIARIRKLESTADHLQKPIVAVALSAHDDPAIAQSCLSAGFDAYLKKPVGKKEVIDTILRFFLADGEPLGNAGASVIDAGIPAPAGLAAASPGAPYTVEVDADLEELIPSFLESKKEELRQLKIKLDANDYEPVRQISHKLKGAFNMYGFRFLSDACATMEAVSPRGERVKIQEQLDAIDHFMENMTLQFTDDL